mmetsp:Transcript_19068/g.72887  ORF Transcript_19068/g.72887 Transcript_19068/m.72887 type:complete len:337 (-) Transcript_19068:1537-2547(-)
MSRLRRSMSLLSFRIFSRSWATRLSLDRDESQMPTTTLTFSASRPSPMPPSSSSERLDRSSSSSETPMDTPTEMPRGLAVRNPLPNLDPASLRGVTVWDWRRCSLRFSAALRLMDALTSATFPFSTCSCALTSSSCLWMLSFIIWYSSMRRWVPRKMRSRRRRPCAYPKLMSATTGKCTAVSTPMVGTRPWPGSAGARPAAASAAATAASPPAWEIRRSPAGLARHCSISAAFEGMSSTGKPFSWRSLRKREVKCQRRSCSSVSSATPRGSAGMKMLKSATVIRTRVSVSLTSAVERYQAATRKTKMEQKSKRLTKMPTMSLSTMMTPSNRLSWVA